MRPKGKRHRTEDVVATLRQADEAMAKGTPIAEVTLRGWRAEYGAATGTRCAGSMRWRWSWRRRRPG
jgi:hypothetical protein